MGALERENSERRSSTISYGLAAFFITALVIGAWLRLSYPADMEYKGDERFMFDRSQRIGVSEPWPELGMTSGGGLKNPAFSIWIFVILARAFGAVTPLALDHAVVLCNVAAFVIFFAAVYRMTAPRDRETWLWAGALATVSPVAVLLHRKIWAQSTLPIFCVLFLCGWLKRGRYEGAILWGLMGALLGQIHMSGFFFAFGFFAWEAAFGRTRTHGPKTKWLGWIGGSILGSITLVPWIKYVLSGVDHGEHWTLDEVVSGRFLRTWFSDGLGLGLDYSLGGHYLDFLRWPLLGETKDFYPALYMQGATFCAGTLALVLALVMLARWLRTTADFRAAIRGSSEISHTLAAAFFGFGLALTLSGVHIFRHYLLVTFPLEWASFAWLAFKATKRPRAILAVMWCAQLGLSATFLTYIHENGGAPGADYGVAYSAQPRNRLHR